MKNYGFTLIELMVTLTIMLIITGGAIAGFINFRDRRNVDETAKQLQQIFIAARNKAEVKETPSTCTAASPLQGYRVEYDEPTVMLRPLCGADPTLVPPGVPVAQDPLPSYNLVIPADWTLSFGEGTLIDFYTLERGTSEGDDEFTITGSSVTYGFEVNRGEFGGTISNVQEY